MSVAKLWLGWKLDDLESAEARSVSVEVATLMEEDATWSIILGASTFCSYAMKHVANYLPPRRGANWNWS